jgi:predicted nucleotidyltransferase component of viral defense system
MTPDNPYIEQVRLLVEVLPVIARHTEFALKGGTAINLFYRNMPRLSVDIDLVYLPIQERGKSLTVIDVALIGIAEVLGRGASGFDISFGPLNDMGKRDKLIIRRHNAEIKIEVATVLRGSLFRPVIKSVGPEVQKRFGPAEMPLLCFEEVFAGKICAALDRQHPRDLSDIRLLLNNEGMTRGLMDAFLVYLVSSPRPMAELLDPAPADLSRKFTVEFEGMVDNPVSLADLVETRARLVEVIHQNLSDADRTFLLDLKKRCAGLEQVSNPGSNGSSGHQVENGQPGKDESKQARACLRKAIHGT